MATVDDPGHDASGTARSRAVDDMTSTSATASSSSMLGPSGAGKTTTLKSVAGLVDIDDGEVNIGGRDDDPASSPTTATSPWRSRATRSTRRRRCCENLASPLKSGRTGNYTGAAAEASASTRSPPRWASTTCSSASRASCPTGSASASRSGGCWCAPADVYLLDEPLSHLDAKLRAAMRAELKQLGAMSNTTTLYVTHDYQEALALGDRIAVLHDGKVVQVGTPRADLAAARRHVRGAGARAARDQPDRRGGRSTGRIRQAGGGIEFDVPRDVDLGRGGRVRLGIRPSDLELVTADSRSGAEWLRVRGTVAPRRAARPQRRARRARRRRRGDRVDLQRARRARGRVGRAAGPVARGAHLRCGGRRRPLRPHRCRRAARAVLTTKAPARRGDPVGRRAGRAASVTRRPSGRTPRRERTRMPRACG